MSAATSLWLAALLLAAEPAPAPAAGRDTLVIGVLGDPVTLDPHRATDLVAIGILGNVCEPLVRYRADGTRPEPALATTWATLDNRTWTFTLREGVRFHDGSLFDADAVVANITDISRSKSLAARAERLGPHAVSVTLEQPNAAFLATLSQTLHCVLSPRTLAGEPHVPVGTGPFRLGATRAGQVELVAQPAHWGGAPRVARLLFTRFPSEAALVQALLAGQADVTSALGLPAVKALRGARDVTLDSRTGLNVCFLSINNARAPFSDRRVREALARALDREAIVRRILDGHAELARTPLPPLLAGPSRTLLTSGRDLSAARRLLRAAGLESGFDTTLLVSAVTRPYLPAPEALSRHIQADLLEVGVRVKLQPVETWAAYTGRATAGEYELAVLGWQADTLDPNDFLSALLGSKAVPATNRSRYKSPAMDALLERGRRLSDPGQRQAVYREALALFAADLPWIPLYHAPVLSAYRRGVHGLVPGPTGVLRFDKAWKAH